jgi:catechol 2,3-dioxygenase-like lactoylglutathione lyase family enzyme
MQPLFKGLHAVIVRVRDMQASRSFFVEQLGLAVLTDTPALCVFEVGRSGLLCAWELEPGEQLAGAGVQAAYPNLETDDAGATHERLRALGVVCGEVVRQGPVRWFAFYDPDGNRYDCCEFS